MPDPWPTPGRTGSPPSRPVAPTRCLGPPTRAATDEDIGRITDDYRRAAGVAVEAGFDCLEIHLGHNYLLSSFLSPRLNRRKDRWGGPLEQPGPVPSSGGRRGTRRSEAAGGRWR